MKRKNEVKVLVSQPVRSRKHVIKNQSGLIPTTPKAEKHAIRVIKPDEFSFEAEIARYAHLNGFDEGPHFNPLALDEADETIEIQDEASENNHEETVSYIDNHREVIDKISRSQRSEEKEGWEAFYE